MLLRDGNGQANLPPGEDGRAAAGLGPAEAASSIPIACSYLLKSISPCVASSAKLKSMFLVLLKMNLANLDHCALRKKRPQVSLPPDTTVQIESLGTGRWGTYCIECFERNPSSFSCLSPLNFSTTVDQPCTKPNDESPGRPRSPNSAIMRIRLSLFWSVQGAIFPEVVVVVSSR